MSAARTKGSGASVSNGIVLAVLLVLSFLSSGAWLITRLPPVPVGKMLQSLTVSAWLIALGVGWIVRTRLDRRLWGGIWIVVGVVLVSALAAGSLLQTALYDLYADMPLLQWAAFLVVFAIAAGVVTERRDLWRGLMWVVAVGAALAGVLAVQQVLTGTPTVFGSSAYSVIAFAPLVPVGMAVAVEAPTRVLATVAGGCAAVIAIVLALFAGSTMGMLVSVFVVALGGAVVARSARWPSAARVARVLLAAGAALLLVAILVAQVPAISGPVLGAQRVAGFDKNILSRWYLWEGAQQMVAERPLLGFGPSGYRVFAAEYLDPRVHELGPGALGDIGPTAYSPQSPHSLVWEIGTRLGVAGLLAFGVLLFAGALVLVGKVRGDDEGGRTLRLGLAAGFAGALFAMMTNPVVFAVGLLAPVVAGLAIAHWPSQVADHGAAPRARWVGATLVGAAVVLAGTAVWLFVGEWRLESAPADDAPAALAAYESALELTPANPVAASRAFEMRLLTAADDEAVRRVHDEVDRAPGYIKDFAPNLVSLAAYSLAQAEQTGRVDVVWESRLLAEADEILPPIPSLVAEKLHAALVSRDPNAIAAAVPDARQWGAGYALTEGYLDRAEAVLGPLE